MKIFITVILTIAGISVLGFLFMISGIFNPSALVPHTRLTLWAINTTKDISIERRAKKITVPELNDPTLIKIGFEHYNEMCVVCHAAPGIEKSEFAKGLYPHPPRLYKETQDLEPKETFWIIKNGIKLTGMPAFGPTHSDEKIWAITSFVLNKLGNMTPEDYSKRRNELDSMKLSGQ